MNTLKLAFKMLWRESRAGELTILVLALLIAVTSSTAITLFASRMENTLTDQAAEFLAADLVLSGHAELPAEWLDQARKLQLNTSRTAEFSSVLMEGDELLLAGVKAVSRGYPLRGYLKTAAADLTAEKIEHAGPAQGEVWVESRVLSAIKLTLGDLLTVGEKPLKITRLMTYEPDKRGDLYSLAPRVMINYADLAATNVVQPGSHVHYAFQFSGESTAVKAFRDWVKPRLDLSQRIMDIHGDRPELGSALDRTQRYLGLSSIVVIIISGVAIALATRRYTERHLDTAAILRCLGSRQRRVFALFLCQFIVLGCVVSVLGCLFGWGLQEALFALLKDLLPKSIAQPDWLAALTGVLTGVLVLMGFALPPLLRIKRIAPMRILRRDLEPLPVSGWVTYGLSCLLVSALIWRYTGDAKMTATLLVSGVFILIALMLLLKALLAAARAYLSKLGLNWRFGLQSLVRNGKASLSQIIGFTITLVAMALSLVVRNDLLDTWQKQLPENAPNYFVINVFPDQVAPLKDSFESQNIQGSRFYPIVRGRLTEINAVPVQKVVSKDSQGENATHRELSLTWASTLPDENRIVAGTWGYANNPPPGQVSVEEKLAASLNIKVGDNLLFVIGGQRLNATVASIRALQWDTMKPNFYMIFSPGTLERYPTTYISSFHLPNGQKHVLNQLVKQYPAITLLEVEQILAQLKILLKQLTGAINYLLYFALAAGFTVLLSAIYSSLDNRLYESALLRTFGASRGLLRKAHWIEFGLIGLISGLLAVAMMEALLYALYTRVLHIDYRPSWYLWLALPIISTLAVSVAGSWATRRVVTTPPIRVLRNL